MMLTKQLVSATDNYSNDEWSVGEGACKDASGDIVIVLHPVFTRGGALINHI